MRFLNFIFYTVWLLILAVLQTTVAQWIGMFGISPNLFLVFIVSAAFLRGKAAGAVCGAVFGLVFDMLIGRLIGINALIFMYVGFFSGILCERFINGTGSIMAAVAILALSAISGIIYYIAYSMVYGDIGFWRALIRVVIPEAIYTSVVGMLIFAPIRKSFGIISRRNML